MYTINANYLYLPHTIMLAVTDKIVTNAIGNCFLWIDDDATN